jgi:hypothetical protein
MAILSKRTLLVAALIGGLVYASEYYSIRGLDALRIEPKSGVGGGDSGSGAGVVAKLKDWVDPKGWFPVYYRGEGAGGASGQAGPVGSGSGVGSGSFGSVGSTADQVRNADIAGVVVGKGGSGELVPSLPVTPTLRIASFDLQGYDEEKSGKLAVQEIIARVSRNFDVVAFQGITSRQRDVLPKLVDRINQGGGAYDYLVGPRVGPLHQAMHLGFVYNTQRVETDRYQLYTVEDPGELLEFDPLVGWFRSRLVPAERALTFSLVNMHLSPARLDQELGVLAGLVESIGRDGRGEDDIILAGGFGVPDARLESLRSKKWIFAIENMATTIRGDEMLDHILFPPSTGDEFTGRSGVIDFLRKFNLSLEQAGQVSEHLPVWSEFFAEEGGYPGYR